MQREGYLRKKRCSKASGAISCSIPSWNKEWQHRKVDIILKTDSENDGGKEIEFLDKNQNDLEYYQPLWEKLHAHHLAFLNISKTAAPLLPSNAVKSS